MRVILFNRSAREPKIGEVCIFGLGQLYIRKNAETYRYGLQEWKTLHFRLTPLFKFLFDTGESRHV